MSCLINNFTFFQFLLMATLAQSASALQLPPRPPKAQTGLPYAAPFITPTKPRLTLDV